MRFGILIALGYEILDVEESYTVIEHSKNTLAENRRRRNIRIVHNNDMWDF